MFKLRIISIKISKYLYVFDQNLCLYNRNLIRLLFWCFMRWKNKEEKLYHRSPYEIRTHYRKVLHFKLYNQISIG